MPEGRHRHFHKPNAGVGDGLVANTTRQRRHDAAFQRHAGEGQYAYGKDSQQRTFPALAFGVSGTCQDRKMQIGAQALEFCDKMKIRIVDGWDTA